MTDDGIISTNLKPISALNPARLQIAYDLALRNLGLHTAQRLRDEDITNVTQVMWIIYRDLREQGPDTH